MSYWESEKIKESAEAWRQSWEGSMACACDHGCNQWIMENRSKAALMIRILLNKEAITNPDKIAQMHVEKADKIWRRLQRWEMRRLNRQWREETKKEKENV